MSRPLALVAVLAAAFALAACGGSEGEEATAGGAPAAVTSSGAAPAGDIGEATTADAEEGGAEEEAAPDVGELEDIPQEGVGSTQTQCAGIPETVTAASVAAAQSATLCLINAERTSRGLKPLKLNAKLARAATNKATDMVRRRYFAHDTPDGKRFTVMVKRAGYGKGARRWSVGENLGWGGGTKALPTSMIESWLASPPHRANLLSRKWNEVGVGLALGTPTGAQGATYATEFGKLG